MKVKKVHKYKVIGVMSGTSLDGVDFAYCKFTKKRKEWAFSIQAAQTFPYPEEWKNKLRSAHVLSGEALSELNSKYGKFLGQLCNQFIRQKKVKGVDLIASHGHTIFHSHWDACREPNAFG